MLIETEEDILKKKEKAMDIATIGMMDVAGIKTYVDMHMKKFHCAIMMAGAEKITAGSSIQTLKHHLHSLLFLYRRGLQNNPHQRRQSGGGQKGQGLRR